MKLIVNSLCRLYYVLTHAYFYITALFNLKPARGFTLVGPFSSHGSLGKVMRDIAAALKDAGIPYQTWSTTVRRLAAKDECKGLMTPRWRFRSRRFSHVIEMGDSGFPSDTLGLVCFTIAFWEFDTGFVQAHPYVVKKRNLIGMSDFCVETFRKAVPDDIHVFKLAYPFRSNVIVANDIASARKHYNLGLDEFVVFFNFDYGSSADRKNPEGVVYAFARAFQHDVKARLVFKTMNATNYPQRVQKLLDLVHRIGIASQFTTIDNYVSQSDLYTLTAASDVYISLHRGEGFGLGIAEAMSLGKAVVVTDFSSTKEFCTIENSIPIPYSTVIVPESIRATFAFHHVETWAEPDIEKAAQALYRLRCDPALRSDIGSKAKRFIASHFSIDEFRKSAERLLEVEGMP